MRTKTIIILTGLAWSLSFPSLGAAAWDSDAVAAALKARIHQLEAQQRFECRGELICGIADLPLFYRRNDYQTIWLDGGKAHPRVNDLLAAIQSSRHDGLTPGDYHLEAIEALRQQIQSRSDITATGHVEALADLELLCTDAFLLLGSHLLAGRINPETLYAKWIVADPQADLAAILQQAVDDNLIETRLEQLLPPHHGYTALKKALAHYRQLAADHAAAPIPGGRIIREGDREPRVPAIRRRLQILGDLTLAADADSDRFDSELLAGVIRFQNRHGLTADGIVGSRTLAALNVTPAERIEQIKLNLERWRWIPHDLGERHLLVNIADYSLSLVDAGRSAMQMRVVVGRNYRKTPVFSDTLEYIEINPYWNVPTSIAVKDLLPRIKKDTDFLRRNDFSLFAGWGKDDPEIDPADIDWSQMTPDNFWYRLRQNPGPLNALGRIKFMFPNRFAVYLHDTPSRHLFEANRRGFSSGCIRVERPIDLAEYLLGDPVAWKREKILAAVADGRRTVVPLKSRIDIHITYCTAWVDREGKLQFRDDIYERDEPLADALEERLPRSVGAGHAGEMG